MWLHWSIVISLDRNRWMSPITASLRNISTERIKYFNVFIFKWNDFSFFFSFLFINTVLVSTWVTMCEQVDKSSFSSSCVFSIFSFFFLKINIKRMLVSCVYLVKWWRWHMHMGWTLSNIQNEKFRRHIQSFRYVWFFNNTMHISEENIKMWMISTRSANT